MPQSLIVLNTENFRNPVWVKETVQSNEPAKARIRKESESFIRGVIEDDSEKNVVGAGTDAFTLSLWILAAIDENVLTARVINQQRDVIERELLKLVNPEDIEEYARNIGLDITYSVIDEVFRIGFDTFLKNTRRLSDSKYRLIYQPLKGGSIQASSRVIAKVIREYFVAKAFEIVDGIDHTAAVESLGDKAEFAASMKKLYKEVSAKRKIDLGSVDVKLFPPCIREYMSEMSSGINLPHLARLALASFLHKVGMDNRDIADLFKTAPDYDEKTTLYQISHITGEISGTEYSPPKCSTLQTNHLCYKGNDTLCNQEWLKHPLWYYEIKKKHKN